MNVDDAYEEMYSAWRALMAQMNRPVPDWETYSRHMADNSELADEFAESNPLLRATDPIFYFWRDEGISARGMTSGFVDAVNNLEPLLQREEFLPDDMREDYHRLADVARRINRDMVSAMRAYAWLNQMEQEEPVRELLARENTNGMSPEQARFYNLYRRHRLGEGAPAGIGLLDRTRLLSQGCIVRSQVGTIFRELLQYSWGENNGMLLSPGRQANTDILYGFRPEYPGMGEEEASGNVLYRILEDEGIDPDSVVTFAQAMRLRNIRTHLENREFNRVIMHLAAGREDNADEIARFSQSLIDEFGVNSMSGEEAGLRLRRMIGSLSGQARETLIANFDRTIGKYFSAEQIRDGSAFADIRAGEDKTSLLDISREYGGEVSQIWEMTKLETMARLLAGERIDVRRTLPDGEEKWLPMQLETSQRSLERTVENARRIGPLRREYVADLRRHEEIRQWNMDLTIHGFLSRPMEERRNWLQSDFAAAYGLAAPRMFYRDPSTGEGRFGRNLPEVQNEMRLEMIGALGSSGDLDVTAQFVRGAEEVGELQRTIRGLAVYRQAFPAAQAAEYNRYLGFLERSRQYIDRIRWNQEMLRRYPEMQSIMESPNDPHRDSRVPLRRPGEMLDALIEAEASRLHRACMALSQMLRYGAGEHDQEDMDHSLNEEDLEALEQVLKAEGDSLANVRQAVEGMRSSVPQNGNRFADAAVIPMQMGAFSETLVHSMHPEGGLDLNRLSPEQREFASRNLDPVFGRIFGRGEREQLAARGMDIYDCIFVNGRSLSELYRQMPEERPYERMESDMQCRLMEDILNGKRIDVVVTDAEGRLAFKRLMPSDSTGTLRRASRIRNSAHRATPEEDEHVWSLAAEYGRKLENTLSDPAARMAREEYIRYGRGNGMPARDGFAVPLPARREAGSILRTGLPFDDSKKMNLRYSSALMGVFLMQMHEKGKFESGYIEYPHRMILPADPDTEEYRRVTAAREITGKMYAEVLKMTGADQVDPKTLAKMGFKAPEQLFYINGEPLESYLSKLPKYENLVPDYSPDSDYLQIARAEIISATMGNVCPVDIVMPEEDPIRGVWPNVRELRVDYANGNALEWELNSASGRTRISLGDRQRYQWEGVRPAAPNREMNFIYPVTEEERRQRQKQVLENLRNTRRPRIWLAGSPDARLTPEQQGSYEALRRYRFTDRRPMSDELQTTANTLYEVITRQLELGEQEKQLLTDTGVFVSEAEMFYINGMPALDYVRQNVRALRNLQRDSENFDRILKAQVAAAAISGSHIVEIGRVAMDANGQLQAGVTDVHVDLSPVTLPSDGTERERNTVLRDPMFDSWRDERRAGIRADLQGKIDRAARIRYTDGRTAAYSAAARRFDPERADMTGAYIRGGAGEGNLLRQYDGSGSDDMEATRMISAMAQIYLMSQNPNARLIDLVDPEKLQQEKQAAGAAVLAALRKGVDNNDWKDYDEIVAVAGQMLSPLPAQQPGATQPRLDMKKELEALVGLDPDRQPPYSQAELMRHMGTAENSPRVSALLGYVGQLAGDVKRMSRPRMEMTLGRTGSLAQWNREWTDLFTRTADALQLAGREEREWLNTARDYQRIEDGRNPEEMAAAVGSRMNLENVRQIFAAGGPLPAHAGDIQQALDNRHRDYSRTFIRAQGPSALSPRDLVEKPYGELGLAGGSPAVTVSVSLTREQQNSEEFGRLAGLANENQKVPADLDDAALGRAADIFDQMFMRGESPVFSSDRLGRLSGYGLSMMDRIYVDGRSVRDLCGTKYDGLSDPEAESRMKAEFVVQMLKGARIDVAAEQNGVEVMSAVVVGTDVRTISRRAWLTLPSGTRNFPRFIDPARPVNGFAVPPMSPEIAERIYASQWSASEMAVRRINSPAPAPAVEQEGPAVRQVRARWQADRNNRRAAWIAEDSRTGQVADSAAVGVPAMPVSDQASVTDNYRTQLYRLSTQKDEELQTALTGGQGDPRMADIAENYVNMLIRDVTYANVMGRQADFERQIPTRLQSLMGYGEENMTEMFFIDGLSVEEYARQHRLDAGLAAGAAGERNRKVILAAALLSGEHHVDMIRVGLDNTQLYNSDGTVRQSGAAVSYKTGVVEVQPDLTPYNGMEHFYQTRPSRKAERLYGDTSGRSERHEKIKQIADEKLLHEMSKARLEEERTERQELDAAAEQDRRSMYRNGQYRQAAPAQPAAQQYRQPAAASTGPAAQRNPQPAASPTGPAAQQNLQPAASPTGPAAQQNRQPVVSPTGPAAQQNRQASASPTGPSAQQNPQPAASPTGPAAQQNPQPAASPTGPAAQRTAPVQKKDQEEHEVFFVEKPARKKVGLDGVISGGFDFSRRERPVELGDRQDEAWADYQKFRKYRRQESLRPEPEAAQMEMNQEYRMLAWAFLRAIKTNGDPGPMRMDDPGINPAAGKEFSEIPADMHKNLRQFIYDVRTVLNVRNPESRAQALEGVRSLNMEKSVLDIQIPAFMDFNNWGLVRDFGPDFERMYHLTGILIDLDRAANPQEERSEQLELMHRICEASVKAYSDAWPVAEQKAAREVLKTVSQVMEQGIGQKADITQFGVLTDYIIKNNLADKITGPLNEAKQAETPQGESRKRSEDLRREIRGTEKPPVKKQPAEKRAGMQAEEQSAKKQSEEKPAEKQSGEKPAQKKQPGPAGPMKG